MTNPLCRQAFYTENSTAEPSQNMFIPLKALEIYPTGFYWHPVQTQTLRFLHLEMEPAAATTTTVFTLDQATAVVMTAVVDARVGASAGAEAPHRLTRLRRSIAAVM